MAARRRSWFAVVLAAIGGAALAGLCLVTGLWMPRIAKGSDERQDADRQFSLWSSVRGPIIFDPEFKLETRALGPAQQFEARLRLVLPNNPKGYGLGFRQTVDIEQATLGRFIRMSVRLPGAAQGPRPRIELSIVVRDHNR